MTEAGEREEIRGRLEEERTRLQQIRQALAEEVPETESERSMLSELSTVDQHPADVGTEMFERSKDLSIAEEVDAELADVDRAMQRLADGTYGVCEACGRPISPERLRAKPATRFCVDDQARAEREAGAV